MFVVIIIKKKGAVRWSHHYGVGEERLEILDVGLNIEDGGYDK